MTNKKITTTFGAQGISGPFFPQGKWMNSNYGYGSGTPMPIGSGTIIPPCDLCNNWHTIAYDNMSKLKHKEEFDKFFRLCISSYYKTIDPLWKYNVIDVAYGNLKIVKAFVNGHFNQYSDLLERYLVLK